VKYGLWMWRRRSYRRVSTLNLLWTLIGLEVLEQNYEYDLLNPQKLLDKYVGKEVKLYYRNPYSEREEIVTATLLSNNGGPIFKIGDEITFGHPGRDHIPGSSREPYFETGPLSG